MDKKERFNKICRDIKSIKIQGARNIAKSALYAYSLIPSEESKKKLLSLRPTEPMLARVLEEAGTKNYSDILAHFSDSQDKINKKVFSLIKNNDIIFTHCHSTNVVNSLIYSKKHGKKFQVYNTETRPLLQGRRTSKELSKAGIKVTQFIDSALGSILSGDGDFKKPNKIFIGADALLKTGIINKVGSFGISQLALLNRISLFIIADSWKFSKKPIPIEQRKLNEVWDNAPKGVRIKNPAFEFVPKKYIKAIISELGVLRYDDFVRRS